MGVKLMPGYHKRKPGMWIEQGFKDWTGNVEGNWTGLNEEAKPILQRFRAGE